jgi:hypothetical protein
MKALILILLGSLIFEGWLSEQSEQTLALVLLLVMVLATAAATLGALRLRRARLMKSG